MHQELPKELAKQLPSWPNISEHSERENHSLDHVPLHHVIFLGDHGTSPQYKGHKEISTKGNSNR
jgi:hypothetical protein